MSATQAGPAIFVTDATHPLALQVVSNVAGCFNAMMQPLSPQERLEMMFLACDGYCERCGFPLPERARCCCMDEV